MRTVTYFIVTLTAVAVCAAQPVVSNTYDNLDPANALTNVPVTLSRIGADGHFTKGITPSIAGKKLPAQVDVLRRAPDGSIRHALVSFVLPHLPAGGRAKVDWLNEKPPTGPAFKRAVELDTLGLKLILDPEKGRTLTSDAGELLRLFDRVKVLHEGPVMKEYEVHDVPVDADGKPDPHLDIYWRIRVFTGQESIRVAAVVERTKDRKKSGPEPVQYKFKSVKLLAGEKVLYEQGAYDHLDQTRYRILVWTDGPLEDIHRRPNYEYWWRNRFVPKFVWVKPKTAGEVDQAYTAPEEMRLKPKHRQGILESGIILRHMPNTGGRWDLGPYPSWTIGYLLSGGGPKTYRALLHADGNGGGAFFIHVRQGGAPGYNVFTVKQPAQDRGYRPNLYRLPDGKKTPCQPDHAHTPSIGYISYLLTGDKYYAEEASFWAAYQMGEYPHKGLRWRTMDRSFAWSLRMTADAAFILPDDHPLRAYFTDGVNRCMDQMTETLVKSGRRVHSPIAGNFQCSGRQNWVNAERCSAWMYAWVVWALGNAADKGFAGAAPVRDWAAGYIVGLYTSEDKFKAPDGNTYRYNHRDAMPYSTAISLLATKIVPLEGDKKGVRKIRRARLLDNYGAVWYYTKLNVDNGWYSQRGLEFLPDADGVWPLRPSGEGFGDGKMYWAWARKVTPHFRYHVNAATGMSVAVEAGVPKARLAWKRQMEFGGKEGKYGHRIVPRVTDLDAD